MPATRTRIWGAGILVFSLIFGQLLFLGGCGTDSALNPGTEAANDPQRELIRAFQPVLVQKWAADYGMLPYPMTSDLIGSLSLEEAPGAFDYNVRVDTSSPVLYSFVHTATIRNREYTQLVYAFFYPERPLPLNPADNFAEWYSRFIWSGLIDGKVVRITLDAEQRIPLFVEVVRNCGCSWQFYVNGIVDDAARAQFENAGQVYPGLVKGDAPNDVQYVWVIPDDVRGAKTRVVVVAEEGWGESPHHTQGAFTSYDQWLGSGPAVLEGVVYIPEGDAATVPASVSLEIRGVLRLDYAVLHALPPEGTQQAIGIFDDLHYVWNAYSPLTQLMRALGAKKFPGTPKDPEHLEVVHETLDFWDTSLYERFIHLPDALFGTGDR